MIKLDAGRMQQGSQSITLDATGNASAVQVTYPQAFAVTPQVTVVAPFGATQAQYSASTVTTESFYLTVGTETITTFKSQTFPVQWVAVEPG